MREAAVSTRDEDIIVEVPGEDEKSFSQIRETISKTARLEFKLFDDDTDFFAGLSKKAAPESLPEGLSFFQEGVPLGKDADGKKRSKTSTYAFLKKADKETSTQTLQRFRAWVATLELPTDREIGYQLEFKAQDDAAPGAKQEESGFRTYYLKRDRKSVV